MEALRSLIESLHLPEPWWVAPAMLVGGAALVAVVTLRLAHAYRVWRMKRRFARGREGEMRAVSLLEAHGFQVIDEQVSRETGLTVDGDWRPVTVRADLLAEKGGRRFVVEVKTGSKAPDPASAATRRQLFEYHHVFDADGLLLADMEREALMTIEFPVDPPAGPWRRRVRYGVMVFLVGLSVGVVLGWMLGR